MSLLSRLFGRSPPPAARPATVTVPPAAAERPPRPDSAARLADEESRLSQAIAEADAVAIGKWVIEGSSTRIRQRAAQAVTDPGQLAELVRATRGGNDKNVYRILTSKRDELLARARHEQKQRAEIEAAAAAIARHSERTYDALYLATLAQLESRWHAVAMHASPDLQEEVTRQLTRARAVVEAHRQAIDAEIEHKRSVTRAAEEARRQRALDAEAAAMSAAEEARVAEAAREAERVKLAAEDAAVRELVGLLRQARAALDRAARHGPTASAR
jgi:hypothetical protein